MKFLADECCNAALVENLRAIGEDVLYIVEEGRGVTDTQGLATAFAEKRVLITEDKDFGELVYRLKKETSGIILLRFQPSQSELKWQRLSKGLLGRRS
jgi:predicted nuclease of predicted toxin-antitoxin system